MSENLAVENNRNGQNAQNKVLALFHFIEELNKLKQKPVINISEYDWYECLSQIPDDPEHIKVTYRDSIAADESEENDEFTLLSVKKSEFEPCPAPDPIFREWLEPGWDSYRNEPKVVEFQTAVQPEENVPEDEIPEPELFAENAERVKAFKEWVDQRNIWVERQKIIQQTRNLFTDLYQIFFELQRNSETTELIAANGMLYDSQNSEVRHPVLTHRVKVKYDPAEDIVSIIDLDVPSELYSVVFQGIEDVNLAEISVLQKQLQENDYHPIDRNDTPNFLKVLIHRLSSKSVFSDSGVPENWKENGKLLLRIEPCFIMRKRMDGTLKAIEQIVENIQDTGYVPAPIADIVGGGKIEVPDDNTEETLEEQLASVGGESIDVLLSKEANKEQLEIAKRIEKYNAVLVQGPPGTGKTHTIANLLGHFLAHGKSVLVTSQTTKALKVLKEKVAPGLQNLCVSVLEDSNLDMERSVDGITEYMAKTTSYELKREMENLALERNQIIDDLAQVRRKLFQVINQECNSIVYNGEEYSPSKAAAFVWEHTEDLSYIPGNVKIGEPLPLSFSELTDLYRSNEGLTAEDEEELENDIPDPQELLSPEEYSAAYTGMVSAQNRLTEIGEKSGWQAEPYEETQISFKNGERSFTLDIPDSASIQNLKESAGLLGTNEEWMVFAALDGKKGGPYRERWEKLIAQINDTCEYAAGLVADLFDHDVQIKENTDISVIRPALERMQTTFAQKGKLSKVTLFLNKEFSAVLEAVSLNGQHLQSAEDCALVLRVIMLQDMRNQCAAYWSQLMTSHGLPEFWQLNKTQPESVAKHWIPQIEKCLGWYENEYADLLVQMAELGIPTDRLTAADPMDSDIVATEKTLNAISSDIPVICEICEVIISLENFVNSIHSTVRTLRKGKRTGSNLCNQLAEAAEHGNQAEYTDIFSTVAKMFQKYSLREKRSELLVRLAPVAPQWAEAIRDRLDIHGNSIVPETIEEAWKWKQLSGMVSDLTAQPFSQLQDDSIRLSKEYRKITAQYAEKSAWYHLMMKTEGDLDMQHALQGWKQTVKKIGKGTGKNAPKLRAKARALMCQCQAAVPSWIMPINRALENLDPRENRFDIIIIDEASQSDVSSLAILYMGKKLIIVGDDKQVSPMAVGVELEKINQLQQIHLENKVPLSHIYDGKTSIYDIAKTTFKPLMLKEHFRCVPEIIGFSNMLSYDYKIKPLRDASNSVLLPAVVNFRVMNGERAKNKTNEVEARAIVALMQACMEQPEYDGKSFGVVSLLGDEQVKVLQRLIEENISAKDIIDRRILCGNASNFQGDERDVIFLSLVDSGTGKGPIALKNFGSDDSNRKRYNVAASRAKDQLWVVDSLDSANDLKPGDIRKTLIDYSMNPGAFQFKQKEYEKKSESPFELAVVAALGARGYHLVQQWPVGAYRLDIVAVCGKKTVAIECDGERYHSGEAKIREDMERQTILERLGWRFIRIRGSEYFRNPEDTIERVLKELKDFGIEPEDAEQLKTPQDTDLLQRVKARAAVLLGGEDTENIAAKEDTIAAALDPKSMIPEEVPEEIKSLEALEGTSQPEEAQASAQVEPARKQTAELPAAEPTEQTVSETEEPELPVVTSETGKEEIPQAVEKHSLEKPREQQPEDKPEDIVEPPNEKAKTEPIQKPKPVVHKSGNPPSAANETDIIQKLKKAGIPYVDKRKSGGALWIIGGTELRPFVNDCKKLGLGFQFKAGGGRATRGKDAWWGK